MYTHIDVEEKVTVEEIRRMIDVAMELSQLEDLIEEIVGIFLMSTMNH
jgi:hypothetical protein